jgi:prevent-host-death family protein
MAMRILSAREAKNRFGAFLDAARREPVVVTQNDRPVRIMIAVEDAVDPLLPEFLFDKDSRYGGWLCGKVSATLVCVDAGEAAVRGHVEAMAPLRERLWERVSGKTA